jgi:hypothetical protein
MEALEFIALLDGVQQRGTDKWIARCPSHDDKDPSLSIAVSPTGKILIHCWAGCSALEIVHSLDLELSDLFPVNDYERPMAFAQLEMKKITERRNRVEHAKTFIALVTADLKSGKTVPEHDLNQARQYKQYLERIS